MVPAFAVGDFPAQMGVADDLGAQTQHPGRGQGEDEPQAIGMGGGANPGALPLPAARFEVPKGGLFPHPQAIPTCLGLGPVGQEQPGLRIAPLPAVHAFKAAGWRP